jgi:hypothetical protein
MGRPTLLTMDKEALLVAQGETKAVASQPVGRKQLGEQLSLMVEACYPNRKKSSITTSAKSIHKHDESSGVSMSLSQMPKAR